MPTTTLRSTKRNALLWTVQGLLAALPSQQVAFYTSYLLCEA